MTISQTSDNFGLTYAPAAVQMITNFQCLNYGGNAAVAVAAPFIVVAKVMSAYFYAIDDSKNSSILVYFDPFVLKRMKNRRSTHNKLCPLG